MNKKGKFNQSIHRFRCTVPVAAHLPTRNSLFIVKLINKPTIIIINISILNYKVLYNISSRNPEIWAKKKRKENYKQIF